MAAATAAPPNNVRRGDGDGDRPVKMGRIRRGDEELHERLTQLIMGDDVHAYCVRRRADRPGEADAEPDFKRFVSSNAVGRIKASEQLRADELVRTHRRLKTASGSLYDSLRKADEARTEAMHRVVDDLVALKMECEQYRGLLSHAARRVVEIKAEKDKRTTCSVCYGPLESLYVSDCMHGFCGNCVAEIGRTKCPRCRRAVVEWRQVHV